MHHRRRLMRFFEQKTGSEEHISPENPPTKIPEDPKYQQDIGRVTKNGLGERGKYQFYKIAKIKITPDCIFRMGLSDWWDFKTPIDGAYVMGAFNNAEVYASLKFEGPAFYAEDAGKENLVYCDRVVVVRLD